MSDAPPARRHGNPWLLPALLVAGAAAGVLVGATMGARWKDPALEPAVLGIRLLGTVFLSLLKALVVPLVVTSMIVGVAQLGDLRRVGRLAGRAATYFVSTTLLAVVIGMVLVNAIAPGHRAGAVGTPTGELATVARTPAQALYEVIAGMFPPNAVAAATEGNVLGLIVLSLLFGGALTLGGERARRVIEIIEVVNEALLRIVRLVVWLAPIGVFGLVADRLGKAGGGGVVGAELERLSWYAVTVVTGLFIHGVVILPLLLAVLARRSPRRYGAGMTDALLTAFGTASSAATMAVTLRCVTEKNGVSRRAADFVIPLGTTINMDGTALYEAVAAMFLAQSLGVELTFAQQAIVLLTATLAAIGAAAIPEAGLITLMIVVSAVGLPPESIGLIISIDWILDRFRTTVNVWGDAVGAAIIDRQLERD